MPFPVYLCPVFLRFYIWALYIGDHGVWAYRSPGGWLWAFFWRWFVPGTRVAAVGLDLMCGEHAPRGSTTVPSDPPCEHTGCACVWEGHPLFSSFFLFPLHTPFFLSSLVLLSQRNSVYPYQVTGMSHRCLRKYSQLLNLRPPYTCVSRTVFVPTCIVTQ